MRRAMGRQRAARRAAEEDTTWKGRLLRHRFALGLALALALAAALRLWGLGRQSLWWDEAYSITWGGLGFGQILDLMVHRDYHPPEYYFLLHVWMGVVGSGPVAARLLSALLGVAGAALLYLLGRDLFDRRVGVIAALLLAVSVFHLYYSQEVRSYVLLFAASVAATHAYWLLFHSEGRRGAKAAYFVAASLLVLYAHYTGLFVVVAHFLHRAVSLALRPDRRALRLWAATQAAVALLYLPWALVLAGQATRLQQGFWVPEPSLDWPGGAPDFSIVGTFRQFLGGAFHAWVFWALVANAFVASTLAGLNRERNPDGRPDGPYPAAKLWLLAAWLLCSLLLPFLQSMVSQPIYISRIVIPALAPFTLLAAVGIARLRAAPVRWGILALAVGLAVPGLHAYETGDAKERWDLAVADVDQGAAPGAAVVMASHAFTFLDAYSQRSDLRRVGLGPAGELANQTRDASDVWLLGRQGPVCGQPDAAATALAQGRTLASCKPYMPSGLADFPLAANPVYVWHFVAP